MAQNIKPVYVASSDLTFTSLNSLAASSSLLAGASSLLVDNSANLYADYNVGGYFAAAAANTQAGVIEVWTVPMLNDTQWPDVFDGTDSAKTITSAEIKAAGCGLLAALATTATASRVYPMKLSSVANALGLTVAPRKFLIFVTHTAQTSTNGLASSGHKVSIQGVYNTVG